MFIWANNKNNVLDFVRIKFKLQQKKVIEFENS
jgi:hypothetical protein